MDSSLKWMEMSSRFWALYGCRIVAATPLKRAGTLVDPSVTGDHLGHSHRRGSRAVRTPDRPCSRRDSSAATGTWCRTGHSAGNAPRGSGPPCRARVATRPPGRRNRPPGEPGRASAHQDGEQEKDAERVLVGQRIRESRNPSLSSGPPAFEVGCFHLRPRQKLAPASTQRNRAVDHDIAAVGELQGMERVLLDQEYGELFFRVQFSDGTEDLA